ncbi:MAG: D-alanine--D-alanine ligase [Planctomycetes bacterium]|nr:D-alanine--D-alanine ligase [Planctomycetota bacterium]
MMKKHQVVVMEGGFSSEREISLRTGKGVKEALREKGFDVRAYDVRDRELRGFDPAGVDVAFLALHGTFGEDGGIQSRLEDMGVPYTGSGPEASRLAMDKVAAKQCFAGAGLRTAPHVYLKSDAELERARARILALGMPVVVKPVSDGSSMGLSLVRNLSGLADAVRRAGEFHQGILVEAYVPGRELTVGILGDEPLPVIEIRPRGQQGSQELFDVEAKYSGLSEYDLDSLPAPVAARVQEAAWAAHSSLGCRDVSRVDFRMEEGATEPVVLEVNTIPGMTATSLLPKAAKKAGLSYADLCGRLVGMSLQRQMARRVAEKMAPSILQRRAAVRV